MDKTPRFISAMVFVGLLLCFAVCAHAEFERLDGLIGDHDAVLVMSESKGCVYQKNMAKPLIPASTLKVLTALAAFHYLGENFRFKTEFYMDADGNLTIKGYGDPLLISESIRSCCDHLSSRILKKTKTLKNILIDDSYFADITIPGATDHSSQPYDAVNGALCANFNTVNFTHDANGNLISAESQTPLLPFVIDRIKASGLNKERILLNKSESKVYAGYLFKYFLEQKGLTFTGSVQEASPSPDQQLIYTYESLYSLSEIISMLLEFSNNFIANQLCLTMGARLMGSPATLDKGVSALKHYLSSELNLSHVRIVEGSGLSRENRITARDMDRLLERFKSHRTLMKKKDKVFYKTGTLKGISTRVGYIEGPDETLYRFVVFCNSPQSSEKITRYITRCLNQ